MSTTTITQSKDSKYEYAYYAFISYQRKDEQWAKWLQRKLENYKLPVTNAKEASDKKSKYIRPVFRDKTDLTAGPLPDALKEALHQSRYLIIICSPNAVESPWVNEEIETFTTSGRTEYVIPFIVDGEPYSNDSAKECFPDAIKNIPKDKEPLGVNINENGKERAFIRVVAYMLNVKFDELWNRFERHKRKIRNITIECLALLALIVLGTYDYTRTKEEYYADWVDCNGVAQGVIQLTSDQVDHRYYSYKFEYSRVPFGEKGFYSWRLNRVSIVNSKGVISNYTPDNHAFFYPIQEYKYTDGYVTEIINRDTYNRVVMRYTIKDDYDHRVACLVDMEGKEKHQGSAYLSGSTTAFLSDYNPNMSKIKRFHYTRNEKGYITKVTYHANDADELDESAIGDNNNIYGKLFDLDEFGRIIKVTYINHEGNPMTDKYGVGYIRYNNASFEGNDTTEYLGSDGSLAYNEHKYARQVFKLDKYGNPIEQWYEGADEKPCYDYKNIYRQVISFDDNGCLTEMKYYDIDGNLSYCSDNYAIERGKPQIRNRPHKMTQRSKR
ncbi:MAG: toll/interleukin-1 receptor domain-containing protein [Prevotella sp.]|nr:toll/interleukin-1 receptor domain-containing protein [Prevotella sp.]